MRLTSLATPCAVVLKQVAERNCARMQQTADRLGVHLRPHVKTHKTVQGALLQTGGRRGGISVSTVAEAEFFTANGFDDVLYAVPITPDKLDRMAALRRAGSTVHVCVDHWGQLEPLLRHAERTGIDWSVVLMVDCGYRRDGVDPDSSLAMELASRVHEHPAAELYGVYTHGGHSYGAGGAAEVQAVAEQERAATTRLAGRITDTLGLVLPCVGVGSTPTACNPPEAGLPGVTQLHPGNYIFMDWMQHKYGSCGSLEDVGIRVVTRVVGQYPSSNTLLIDMGWTGCSAQGSEHQYGAIWPLGTPRDRDLYGSGLQIQNLKQEAGEVSTADGSPVDFEKYPVGSMLQLVPYHSCAAAHQHAALFVVDDKQLKDDSTVVDQWERCRGW